MEEIFVGTIFCLVFSIPIMIYNFFPQLKSVMFDPSCFDHSSIPYIIVFFTRRKQGLTGNGI